MKITRNELQRLIQEAVSEQHSVLLESPQNPEDRPYEKDPDGYEGNMAKRELFHMGQKAQQLHDIIMEDENLEPWVQAKITKASAMMSSIFDHMMYKKHPGHVKE
tara:strand:- start:3807 stop:4121 length:315 start_codon:yes stop_codon:yes gene_type:complete